MPLSALSQGYSPARSTTWQLRCFGTQRSVATGTRRAPRGRSVHAEPRRRNHRFCVSSDRLPCASYSVEKASIARSVRCVSAAAAAVRFSKSAAISPSTCAERLPTSDLQRSTRSAFRFRFTGRFGAEWSKPTGTSPCASLRKVGCQSWSRKTAACVGNSARPRSTACLPRGPGNKLPRT